MTVQGFDFSSYQDNPDTVAFIDFQRAITAGAKFAITRCAYGRDADRIFPRGYDDAKAAGLITGVYQFADYRTYGATNVQALKRILAGRVPDFIAIDLEDNEAYWPGLWPDNGARLTTWVSDYYGEYKAEGMTPPLLLYVNVDTVHQMRQSSGLARLAAAVPLWLAHWDVPIPDPADYAPWAKCHFVQPRPSAVGKTFGMESGNLDTDYWTGSLDELKEFVGKQAPPPANDLETRVEALEAWRKQVEAGGSTTEPPTAEVK
jgi:GH25 family lysozyme M1 (1,4-beta-N-acetylmuramidase)